MLTNKKLSCPDCKNEKVKFLGKLQDGYWFAGKSLKSPALGANLYECPLCFLKFRYPLMTEEFYEKHYDNSSIITWADESDRPDWEKIIQHIEGAFPKGATVLDFGCYTGGFLSKLSSNYTKYGVEINQSAAKFAMGSNRVSKVWGRLDEIPKNLKFDVIVASDVIEHMTNPATFLRELIKFLKKDGALIMTSGDSENYLWKLFGANWWYCYYVEHISFISKTWAEKFCTNNMQIKLIEKFYYLKHKKINYLLNWLLTIAYGLFPNFYIGLIKKYKKLRNKSIEVVPRGIGVSPDHILVVMRKLD
jgi:2-polyprenyl-3-methyl-5-hydroxy-6-metoxy-1,4-benzoquinol methylase